MNRLPSSLQRLPLASQQPTLSGTDLGQPAAPQAASNRIAGKRLTVAFLFAFATMWKGMRGNRLYSEAMAGAKTAELLCTVCGLWSVVSSTV